MIGLNGVVFVGFYVFLEAKFQSYLLRFKGMICRNKDKIQTFVE